MPKKKPARTKKSTNASKPARVKKRLLKKAASKKVALKRTTGKKKAVRKTRKPAAKKKSPRGKKSNARRKQEVTNPIIIRSRRGLGPAAGGQSGDTQGLSEREDVDSESVEELV